MNKLILILTLAVLTQPSFADPSDFNVSVEPQTLEQLRAKLSGRKLQQFEAQIIQMQTLQNSSKDMIPATALANSQMLDPNNDPELWKNLVVNISLREEVLNKLNKLISDADIPNDITDPKKIIRLQTPIHRQMGRFRFGRHLNSDYKNVGDDYEHVLIDLILNEPNLPTFSHMSSRSTGRNILLNALVVRHTEVGADFLLSFYENTAAYVDVLDRHATSNGKRTGAQPSYRRLKSFQRSLIYKMKIHASGKFESVFTELRDNSGDEDLKKMAVKGLQNVEHTIAKKGWSNK